ncbi:MAG: AgmX/PglI C-terminal domain-containing protein, partial [Deltaproteobacteria bacterium]|nr:AgmX/PglI C-terminal domain-containing protein [Deltaproteobacteria bacterium]
GPTDGARVGQSADEMHADAAKTVARIDKPPVRRPRPKLSQKMIEKVMRRKGALLQRCADQYLVQENLGKTVALKLKFTIASSGRVEQAGLIPASLETTGFGRCLIKRVRALKFPRHRDRNISISFPLTFQALTQ